jgi:hypothetical protein
MTIDRAACARRVWRRQIRVFGVSSVSAEGYEGPVVFPGAAEAFW